MKRAITIFLLAFFLSACQNNQIERTDGYSNSKSYKLNTNISPTMNNQVPTTSSPSAVETPVKLAENITATIKTNKGTMVVNLFPKIAPNTVSNFVELAKGTKINPNTGKKVSEKPFYDGVIFHRVISGFMIQGGDPNGTGTGGPGYKFADEPVTEKYTRGTIAMANAGPNTNGSQFFIMHKDYALPPNYTIFGRIDAQDTASLATVDAIASVETNSSDKPLQPVTISSVTIAEK